MLTLAVGDGIAAPVASTSPAAHHPYADELAREDLKLEFSPALELEYAHYKTERSISLVRLGSLVTVLLYLAAVLLDWQFHGRLGAAWRYLAVFLLMAPVSLVPVLATFSTRWRRYTRGIATAATIVNALGVIALIHMLTRMGIVFPHTVLSFSLMFFYFLSGLMFRTACPLATATVVAYGVTANAAGMPFSALLDELFILGGLVVLGGIVCYLLEWTERRNWLRGQLVEQLSVHDDLTGLHNRRHFYEQGERLLRQARREGVRLGLLAIDVDFFKQFNDARGHQAGDECLRRVAEVLRGSARRGLDVLARLGGDEFAILSYGQNPGSLASFAEQVRASVERLQVPNPGIEGVTLSLSIGAALSPASGYIELERLRAQADGALYRGKALGRNRVTVEPSE